MPDVVAIKRSLLDSAFAFLKRAIADFDEDLRFSVVNFATATELFLKARLIEEHWSLIFKEIDHAASDRLEKGEFTSVTIAQSITRLKAIADTHVTADAEESFKKISGHRNRALHFTIDHPEPGKEEEIKTSIAQEQLNGWMHIQKLLKQWFGGDEDLSGTLWQINYAMKRHKQFLEKLFKERKAEIDGKVAEGTEYRNCASCGYTAAELTKRTKFVSEMTCLVCGLGDCLVTIPCPTCKSSVEATHYEAACPACKNCGHQADENELREILDTNNAEYYEYVQKNCAECAGYHTVVEHEDLYLCLECFGFSDEISQCDWCNEEQINGGDLEFSFHGGCEFCDGHGGWDKD